jgi:hypothetical protein
VNGVKTLDEALSRLYQILPPDTQRSIAEIDKKEMELSAMLRTNCIDAIERIASAMRYPRIAHSDLTDAIDLLTVALDCAKALDQ